MFEGLRSVFAEGLFGRSLGRNRVATLDALIAALAQESAHVAQSSAYNYLRARTGFMGPKLFTEQAFLEVVEVTRWEAYGAVLADLLLIAEGIMRPLLPPGGTPRIWHEVYRRALAIYPPPAHREDGWVGFESAFAERLATAQAAPPEAPDLIAANAGRALFAHLPLHPDVRRPDEELVVNTVRFRMLRSWESLNGRIEWPTLAGHMRNAPATAA